MMMLLITIIIKGLSNDDYNNLEQLPKNTNVTIQFQFQFRFIM